MKRPFIISKLLKCQISSITRQYSSAKICCLGNTIAIFDSALKSRQKAWSFANENSDYYDYLRKEAAERICDRIDDISRSFPLALEIGSHRGHIYNIINSRENIRGEKGGVGGIEKLIQCDSYLHEIPISNDTTSKLVQTEYHQIDEEKLQFDKNSFDIILSSLSLHWVNDLPSTLNQIKSILKPDGVFIGAMLGGTTLQELKYCLYLG